MGKLVVAGVDGSSSCRAAVETAAHEAARRGAGLRVVHAFGPLTRPMYSPPDPAPVEELMREAADHAHAVAPEVEVTHEVVHGGAVEVLTAESRTADLLVVGARGVGGFVGMLLGSTAVSLAAHAQCPVLVIRGEPHESGPVVVAVDGSPQGERALEFAVAEADLRGAELLAVHVWQPDYAPAGTRVEAAERLLALAVAGFAERYPDVVVRQQVLSGEPREMLIEASRNAQLVVVGARGRGGFAGLLLGSVSQAVLHHAHCPVTVVRGRD
ncbi:universal stress protein [Streptomyces sp. NPDC057412]|uniref:universal stress protein n=1 Tax=Streptomyces sp. NPDC057412 TaxID=3346123 RepID=UPI0036C9F1CB